MNFPPPTARQARVLWFCLTSLAIALLMVLTGVTTWGLGWVLHKLSAVLVPMVFALILAYILDPVVGFFERKHLPRIWSVTLVFALAALLMTAVLGSVLPGLRRETRKLLDDLPRTSELVRQKTDAFLNDSVLGRQLSTSWRETLEAGVGNNPSKTAATQATPDLSQPPENPDTTTNAPNLASQPNLAIVPGVTSAIAFLAKSLYTHLSKISTWAEFLIGFILVPVYLFYFLLEKKAITRHWTDYLPLKPSRAKDETVFVLRAINDCMIVFFRGQVLVALCVGTLLAIGYKLLGLNYSVLLGLVAATLGIVPYLGTVTSLLLALTVAGVQFQDWQHPCLVLAIAALVKMLEDFVIGPRIIGDRSGLHPLTIILAVLVGTTLMGGFIGALLAIPLTAALRTLMYRYIWIREHPNARADDIRRELELEVK